MTAGRPTVRNEGDLRASSNLSVKAANGLVNSRLVEAGRRAGKFGAYSVNPVTGQRVRVSNSPLDVADEEECACCYKRHF